MKKRISTLIMIAVLALALSASAFGLTAFAASGNQSTVSTPARALTSQQRTEINRLHKILIENRSSVVSIKAKNMKQANELKNLLKKLQNGEGSDLSADALVQLASLKNDLTAKREQLQNSLGQINTLMASYRDFRKDKNYDSMVSTLNQVITIQQNRITLCTDINTITQQIIDLLQDA